MSTEFLCANLRNAANEAYKPILLISSDPIDSAISGSRDMASSGMPFYADNLMLEIKEMIEASTQLTTVEKSVLQFELDRKDVDVFSDKNSLFEYRDLLSIMSSGKVNKENFPGFRLFTIDGKADYQTNNKNEVNKFLKQNNELYERIDRSIRIGNLEADLSDDFDDKFIQRIENAKNVYGVIKNIDIENKKILIFDDIYTTGATANECAKVLRKLKPKKIGILTIAKD